jgi:recombination protein RecA
MDFKAAAEKIRKSFKDKDKAASISTGSEMTTPTEDEDFVLMPEWWKDLTGVKGLPFGFVVMIAGNTDSGKTSATIEAMKCAQEQDIKIILVDTEKKTTKTRLTQWGVNPDNLARVQPEYLEDAYDGIDKWIEAIKADNEDNKILLIFDSVGNTPAKKESETDVDDTLQLGLAAKVNKRGFRRLIPRLKRENIAVMLINQTYNNLGSPGRSNAGGKAMDFFSCMTYQTSRKRWLESGIKEKVRTGAEVKWDLYKNHLIESDHSIKKSGLIQITAKGMKLVTSEKKEDS